MISLFVMFQVMNIIHAYQLVCDAEYMTRNWTRERVHALVDQIFSRPFHGQVIMSLDPTQAVKDGSVIRDVVVNGHLNSDTLTIPIMGTVKSTWTSTT